jgi:hypothetical protein
MFKVSACIDTSEGQPGLVIPVFRIEKTNIPFVQEMDEFFNIICFVPYYEADEYSLVPLESPIICNENEPGVIAFIQPDSTVFAGRMKDIFSYLQVNDKELLVSPLLRAQLMRITSADLAAQYDAWKLVAQSCFESERQQEAWVRAELELSQRSKHLWRIIGSFDLNRKLPKKIDYDRGAIDDPERLLDIIANRANFAATNWSQLWFMLLAHMPIDARVHNLASQWLYHMYSLGSPFFRAGDVLCACIEHQASTGEDDPSFVDFLFELVEEGLLFTAEMRIPAGVMGKAFDILGTRSDHDSFLTLVIGLLSGPNFRLDETVLLMKWLSIALRRAGSIHERQRAQVLGTILPRVEMHGGEADVAERIREIRGTVA